jgi:RimJ/RimL family protein N-acetyltransferase
MANENGKQVRFRWLDRLEPVHAERYVKLLNQVLEKDTTVGFPGPLDAATGQKVAQDLDRDLRAGRCHLLIAEDDEKFVFQSTVIQSGSPNNRHMAGIFRSMVEPSERGQGMIWQAMPVYIAKFQELGVETVWLDVRAGCPAEKAWKHIGFKQFGVLPDYSRVNGQSYDGVYLYILVREAVEILRQRKMK